MLLLTLKFQHSWAVGSVPFFSCGNSFQSHVFTSMIVTILLLIFHHYNNDQVVYVYLAIFLVNGSAIVFPFSEMVKMGSFIDMFTQLSFD